MTSQPLRVLAVGDCNTYGILEPPIGNTILDKFCLELSNAGFETHSQNLGCGMATTREGIQRMKLDANAADVVLINFGLVDTWITSIPKCYVLYYPETWLRKRLRKLLKFVKRRLRSPLLRKFVSVGPVIAPEEFAENLRTMISLARDNTPHAKILLWGSPPVQNDRERNENLERYNRILADVAVETESLYVETASLVRQLPASEAYLDLVHLNEVATAKIAQKLASVYQNQQLAAAG